MATGGNAVDLAGQILIAMPGMADPRFDHSVILVCAHSDEGAMGLIVNQPVEDMTFDRLLEQLAIPRAPAGRDIRVVLGGPVDRGRGFVLHSSDWHGNASTLDVPGGYGMTATLDILEALAKGEGPAQAVLALGYSGWGPGQLESEIARNDWLTAPAAAGLVFDAAAAPKWSAALRGLGVDPLTLSATAGRA